MVDEEKWPAAEEKQQAGTHLIAAMTRPYMIFCTPGAPEAGRQRCRSEADTGDFMRVAR